MAASGFERDGTQVGSEGDLRYGGKPCRWRRETEPAELWVPDDDEEGAVGRNCRPLRLLCEAGLRFMAVYCLREFTELEECINGS